MAYLLFLVLNEKWKSPANGQDRLMSAKVGSGAIGSMKKAFGCFGSSPFAPTTKYFTRTRESVDAAFCMIESLVSTTQSGIDSLQTELGYSRLHTVAAPRQSANTEILFSNRFLNRDNMFSFASGFGPLSNVQRRRTEQILV